MSKHLVYIISTKKILKSTYFSKVKVLTLKISKLLSQKNYNSVILCVHVQVPAQKSHSLLLSLQFILVLQFIFL